MDLMKWIVAQHRGVRGAFNATVSSMVTHDQMKLRHRDEGNSIAWVMWHMARTEDVIVNAIIRGQPQLADRDAWAAKIGFEDQRIGTGFGDVEVEDFGKSVDVAALDLYWQAVAESTTAWLKSIDPAKLEEVPDTDAVAARLPEDTFGANNAGLQFWGASSAGRLIGGPVISHGYMHVGEMMTIRSRLGALWL